MDDPHAKLRDELFDQVFDGPGESDHTLRRSAAENLTVPADLQLLANKIHWHAYKVTDGDIAQPQGTYGDDALFEIIVSAALGASRKRLIAGLAALEEA